MRYEGARGSGKITLEMYEKNGQKVLVVVAGSMSEVFLRSVFDFEFSWV